MKCSKCGKGVKGAFSGMAMKCKECGYVYCKDCCDGNSITKKGSCPRCGGTTIKIR